MNLKHFIREISVEPALFVFVSNYHLLEFLDKNFFLQKSCRFNRTLEPDLSTKCDDEEKGILFASKVNSHYYSVANLICILYLIVAVCWSDKAGRRRPLIFLPIAGQILQACSGTVHSYFWSWNPFYAIITNLFSEIMGGGHDLMLTAVQMSICDITNSENRTMRVGFLWLVRVFALPLGKGTSGFLLRRFGFYYSYLFCVVLSIVSLVFGLIFIRSKPVRNVKKVPLRQICDLTPVLDSFKVVFGKRLRSKKTIVVLLLLVQLFGWFGLKGENSVIYLFLKYKFKWNEKKFSVYQVYRYAIIAPGTIFCSVVLSKLMKIHDGIIGVFAAICDTVASVGYTIAFESWHIYVVSLFDIFHGSALSVSLSFVSKFFKSDEFGRLFAVIYVFELFVPISLPVYNIILQNTLNIFPSAYFTISVILNICIALSYWVSYYLDKKTTEEKAPEAPEIKKMMMVTAPTIKVINYKDETPKKKPSENGFRG